jgi:GNAT superfamily N-acetyltransferase
MRHMDDVLAGADRNMRELWAGVAAQTGGARRDLDGLTLVATGVPIAFFNPAFVTAPPADASRLIDDAREFYAERKLPFALYFRDDVAPGMADVCAGAGMVEHWRPPLMVLDPIPPADRPAPDGLEIEMVGAAGAGEYLDTLLAGFGVPPGLIDPSLGRALVDTPGLFSLLGRVDGEPVATSAVFTAGPTAGVYNVATLAPHRGRGYGEALTAAAARAGADRGATHAILQASEAGEPVYRRMGYATPDRYRQFEPAV